ncbi:RNA polymerase sigma factor [Bacillaceae bacterium IKA-2]|nr:RNA polymerase sigma factor [Bacillaceae bacterium IKA-2]
MQPYLKQLEIIYQNYQPLMYAYLLRKTGDHFVSEDLCQDVFIKAFEALPRFRGDASIKSWLYRITHNHYVSYYRKNGTRDVIPIDEYLLLELVTSENSPEDHFLEKLKTDEIHHILSKMKPGFREVLVLRDLHELSYQEIAHILDWSLGKVKITIHRARLQYRNEVEKQGVVETGSPIFL